MGLDMYLSKKTYIGNKYRDAGKQIKVIVPKNQEGVVFPTKKIKSERVSEIIEEVGYWRKANQIHNWFVKNIQDGVDNCEEYYVSEDKMRELLAICKRVKERCPLEDGAIANGYRFEGGVKMPIVAEGKVMLNSEIANSLLPAQSGFFFGSTDYDEYYMNDIDNTIQIIESVLAEGSGDYYYRSSW